MHADTLLVFGYGVTEVGGRFRLTDGSVDRVRAAAQYDARHQVGRVVFTGGWALGHHVTGPPTGQREADLMVAAGRAAGITAEMFAETRSRSTLENVLHTVEERLLGDGSFSAARPLGLVSHGWHLPRVRYLIGKVLKIRGAALVDIPVAGRARAAERLLAAGSRLCFLGSADPDALRRRERLITALGRRR